MKKTWLLVTAVNIGNSQRLASHKPKIPNICTTHLANSKRQSGDRLHFICRCANSSALPVATTSKTCCHKVEREQSSNSNNKLIVKRSWLGRVWQQSYHTISIIYPLQVNYTETTANGRDLTKSAWRDAKPTKTAGASGSIATLSFA